MKRTLGAIVAFAAMGLLAAPAVADTHETGLSGSQVQHELGGYHCGGSSCTHAEHGSIPGGEDGLTYGAGWAARCGRFVAAFNGDCVLGSLVSATSGGSDIGFTVTTTKTLGFDPGSGTFSIDTHTATSQP